MQSFMTPNMEQKFSKTTLMCVLPYVIEMQERIIYQISSTSPFEHKNIAYSMAKNGFLPDSEYLLSLLRIGNGHRAFQEYAKQQHMFYRIPLVKDKMCSPPIVYFSSHLLDYQKIALRLWYEYFLSCKEVPIFNVWNEESQNFMNYETM